MSNLRKKVTVGGGTAIHAFEPALRTVVQITEKVFSKHLSGRLTQLYSSRVPVS
jgi:hypothetical protein